MSKMREKVKRSPLETFLNFAIALLTVILVISVLHMVREIRDAAGPSYSENSLYNAMEQGNYGRMLNMILENGPQLPDEIAEYRAVAFYYMEKTQEKAWRTAGETERAEACRLRAGSYAGQMGTYAPEKDKIDKLLEMKE